MAHAVLCRDADDAKIPPRNYFFHRQADSHYASNLNHKVYPVMRIEDKEKPAYLLGYAYVVCFSFESARGNVTIIW
jgi:hypothetical protein